MKPPASPLPSRLARALLAATLLAPTLASCREGTEPQPGIEVGAITIDQAPFLIERGFHRSLTALVRDRQGDTLDIPVVWRSSNEKVATIDAAGRLTALDTGITGITASTLNATSQPVAVRVVWQGAAKLETHQYTAPNAATPGVTVPDSLRVKVTDRHGNPVRNARVAFAITAGGGTVEPALDTTDASGLVAARLTLGPELGANTLTATVLSDDDRALAFVEGNPLAITITTFAALVAVAGDGQTAPILSTVPVAPAVRVVDAAGNPRPGVPVTFTPSGFGRVATPTVSTDAEGVATPGDWTLGDATGEQTLLVTVESARYTFSATGTGTPIHYTPAVVVAGGFVTCALRADGQAECFGEQPKVGDSSTVNRSLPTLTWGGTVLESLAASPGAISNAFTVGVSHLCGVGMDRALYCWGLFSLTDTSTTNMRAHDVVPTRLASDIPWMQAAPGVTHNCALSTDQAAYCWGENGYGQLGDRSTTRRAAPVPVAGGFRFASITSGSFHSCGLSLGGSAFCWGANGSGQLGDGTTTNRMDPTAVAGALTFQSLRAGEAMTCGLGTDGRAWCWGSLSATQPRQATPREYIGAPVFTALSVGGAHACGLAADGAAWCWGNNAGGQLGDSTTVFRAEPVPVRTDLRFSSVSAGYLHTCGRTTEGAVACWGLNRAGEIGDSTVANRLVPRRIVLGVDP